VIQFAPLDTKSAYAQVPFTTVKEAVITKIQTNGNKGATDVAKCIADEVKFVPARPTMGVSTKTDAAAKAREEAEFVIEFKGAMGRYQDKLENIDEGLTQAYGLIWSEFMSKDMITRIENLPNYESTIRNNVIELLKAIKAQTHESARAQNPIITMSEALTKFLTFKQTDGMSLQEYMISFKEYRDIVKTQMGTEVLNYFITQTQEYKDEQDANVQQELQVNAFERWSAYLLIKHADWRKYGSLITDLKSSYVRSRDEYPRTFEGAVDLLEQHHPDAAWKEYKKQQSKKEDKPKKTGTSFNQKGSPGKDKVSKADLVCFCCGKKGDHKSNECKWETKIAKKDWFKTTGKVPPMIKGSYVQAESDDEHF
jgi:hypothetical protein